MRITRGDRRVRARHYIFLSSSTLTRSGFMQGQSVQGVFPFTPSLPTSAKGPGPALKTTPLPAVSQWTMWHWSESTSSQSPGFKMRWLQAEVPRS